ncbi:MAG: TlpA family protein disulfide reductase [Candidatus Rokubacteria bacterium]|nr:TlpA family protein disulfide reductase [Candidatus Rokubacteria bacterium]
MRVRLGGAGAAGYGAALALIAFLSGIGIGDRTGVRTAQADSARFVPWTRAETPSLSLKDLNGAVHQLADYRGRVVLVNFWATWCEPCRDEMPSMQRLKETFAGQTFEVLAVNYGENPPRVREFVERERLRLVVLLDPGQETAKAWRVRVLPGSYLIGRDGRVRYSVIGELDWATETAVSVVRGLLTTGR